MRPNSIFERFWENQVNRALQQILQVKLGAHVPVKSDWWVKFNQQVYIAAGAGLVTGKRAKECQAAYTQPEQFDPAAF